MNFHKIFRIYIENFLFFVKLKLFYEIFSTSLPLSQGEMLMEEMFLEEKCRVKYFLSEGLMKNSLMACWVIFSTLLGPNSKKSQRKESAGSLTLIARERIVLLFFHSEPSHISNQGINMMSSG